MFNPFKKKERYSDYVIDLGKLKDRGIIKEPVQDSGITADSSASATQGDATSLGFLGSMAASAESSGAISTAAEMPADLREKVDSISERLYRILDRIDLLEHKLGRLERRGGFGENY